MSSLRPIRIAISGGGLAGASLLQALMQYPHLDVHLFESAPELRADGIAMGVTRNAQAALDLIGPPAPQLLKRAGAVAMRGVRFMIGGGEGQGDVIDQVGTDNEERLTSIVHRAAYLKELLAEVPEERLHASKKLTSVDQGVDRDGASGGEDEGPITLHFTDGTTHECDILVGADGIHSTVRKLILGADDPATSPRNTGLWIVMTLQPYARRATLLDPRLWIQEIRVSIRGLARAGVILCIMSLVALRSRSLLSVGPIIWVKLEIAGPGRLRRRRLRRCIGAGRRI